MRRISAETDRPLVCAGETQGQIGAVRMRIVVTGTDPGLAERLRVEGLEAVEYPLVRIEVLDGPPMRADLYDWVVLTSRNAVDALWRRLEGPLPRVAAVGPGTAEALRARALAATGSRLPCVSIGPLTSAEAERRGLTVAGEADTHDREGLVRAVKLAASRAGSSPS